MEKLSTLEKKKKKSVAVSQGGESTRTEIGSVALRPQKP